MKTQLVAKHCTRKNVGNGNWGSECAGVLFRLIVHRHNQVGRKYLFEDKQNVYFV